MLGCVRPGLSAESPARTDKKTPAPPAQEAGALDQASCSRSLARLDPEPATQGWLNRCLELRTRSVVDAPVLHITGSELPQALAGRELHVPTLTSLEQVRRRLGLPEGPTAKEQRAALDKITSQPATLACAMEHPASVRRFPPVITPTPRRIASSRPRSPADGNVEKGLANKTILYTPSVVERSRSGSWLTARAAPLVPARSLTRF
jgi:hypothetical protein